MLFCSIIIVDGVGKEGSDMNCEGKYDMDKDGGVVKGALKDVDAAGCKIFSDMMRGDVGGVETFAGRLQGNRV